MDWPFLLVEARVEGGRAVVEGWSVTTRGQLGRRHWPRQLRVLLLHPVATLWRNRRLIRSMVRRDLAARYRGSVGGAAWTIAHPLLLMLTYLFVFGVVLDARFGNDPSRAGFVLYFLAGMLPWLPFSEAVGRAPTVILDNRNFVKKLVFPVETLPANLAFAGLVAELFGLAVFLALLAATRGIPPLTTLWLPAIAAPQLLLTLGCCWFLAAVGVFLRDLGQVVGFLLTLLFFLTPICYPDDKVPAWALWALQGSPIHALVRCYRAVLLEGAAPPMAMLGGLWLGSAAVCVAGHATFWRLRRMFADAL
jgi:lipopolysaccharide transport system permease protein